MHADNPTPDIVKLIQIRILVTLFELICHEIEFSLPPYQSKNC